MKRLFPLISKHIKVARYAEFHILLVKTTIFLSYLVKLPTALDIPNRSLIFHVLESSTQCPWFSEFRTWIALDLKFQRILSILLLHRLHPNDCLLTLKRFGNKKMMLNQTFRAFYQCSSTGSSTEFIQQFGVKFQETVSNHHNQIQPAQVTCQSQKMNK